MNKFKILIVLLVLISTSCSKKSEIESVLISSKSYYWQYNNECFPNEGLGSVNFQFDSDGYSHQFSLDINKGYFSVEGETIGSQKWSIKNDSILLWNNVEYKINHIDRRIIILQYQDPRDKNKFCYLRLLKVTDHD